jgi:hypothetical protein
MIITLPTDDPIWLDPMVNFLAVLLGAFLAWITSYAFNRKAEKDRDLALAYSLIFKIHELCERIVRLEAHVTECLTQARNQNFDGPSWGVILEAIGFGPEPLSISADELALIARTKDDQLVMKLREVEMGHRICFDCYNRIIERKRLLSNSGLITEVAGEMVSFEATQQQVANLAPLLIELDSSASGLVDLIPRAAKEAKEVASKLGPKLKAFYKFDHFVSIGFPEERVEQ